MEFLIANTMPVAPNTTICFVDGDLEGKQKQ